MDDFLDARELLESVNAGFVVRNHTELSDAALRLLKDPEKTNRIGKDAAAMITANEGAADRHAAVVVDVLSRPR